MEVGQLTFSLNELGPTYSAQTSQRGRGEFLELRRSTVQVNVPQACSGNYRLEAVCFFGAKCVCFCFSLIFFKEPVTVILFLVGSLCFGCSLIVTHLVITICIHISYLICISYVCSINSIFFQTFLSDNPETFKQTLPSAGNSGGQADCESDRATWLRTFS